MKVHCCQVPLVQAACWKGICDLEDRVTKSEGSYFHQRFTRWIICHDQEVAMRLLSIGTRRSVARNDIFSLKWIYYGQKGVILDYWVTVIFFLLYYYIV